MPGKPGKRPIVGQVLVAHNKPKAKTTSKSDQTKRHPSHRCSETKAKSAWGEMNQDMVMLKTNRAKTHHNQNQLESSMILPTYVIKQRSERSKMAITAIAHRWMKPNMGHC